MTNQLGNRLVQKFNAADAMAVYHQAQQEENLNTPPTIQKTAEEWKNHIAYREQNGEDFLDFDSLNTALLDSTDGQVALYNHTHYHSTMNAGDFAAYPMAREKEMGGMRDSEILSFARGVRSLQSEGDLGLIQINLQAEYSNGIACEINLKSFDKHVEYNAMKGVLKYGEGEVLATQYDSLEEAFPDLAMRALTNALQICRDNGR